MASFDRQTYEKIADLIEKEAGTKDYATRGKDIGLSIADVLAATFEGAGGTPMAFVNTTAQQLYTMMELGGKTKTGLTPNPWFVVNGHRDPNNERTLKYLEGRSWKTLGSAAMSAVGTAASAGSAGINIVDLGIHTNAVGSTAVHMMKLVAISKDAKLKEARAVHDWLAVVVKMKAMKAAVRTGSLVGAALPGLSLPVSIAAAVAKSGIKLTMGKVCLATAAAIHWRAYQEQVLTRSGGSQVGPASRIFWEIFTRRGVTSMFGNYDIAALVKEPGGWLALSDKIALI